MGWEVLINDSWRFRFSFFCNTIDRAFGDVFYLDCGSIEEFYEVWAELSLPDPRRMTADERWEAIEKMRAYIEGEEE
tara:strand:+ start:7725 stop:7955 length:231 start_codon:yes stop_codon:yes gene_type:complete